MKMVRAFKYLCLIFSLTAAVSHAKFVVVNAGGDTHSSSGGNTQVVTSTAEDDALVVYEGTNISCTDADNFAPFELVRSLMGDPSQFEVEVDSKTDSNLKLRVTIPPFKNTCIDFKLHVIKSKTSSQSLHIKMEMLDPDGKISPYKYKNYIKCLTETTPDGAPGPVLEIREPADRDIFHAERSTESTVRHKLIEKLDINTSKDVKVYFDGPYRTSENGNHDPVFGNDNKLRSCYRSEDFKQDGYVLYESPETRAAERAFQACKSGDYKRMIKELGSAANTGLSNTGQIQKILRAVLKNTTGERIDDIKSEMTAEVGSILEISKDGFTEDEEDQAKESVERYTQLVTELNEISIEPAVQALGSLMSKRSEGSTTAEQKKEIDEKIKKLNKEIKFFSGKGKEIQIIAKAASEYAMADEAYNIEGFRLKSKNFASVHKDRLRKPRLSITQANDRIKLGLKLMERRQGDWEDAYLAKRGFSDPVLSSKDEYERAIGRLSRDQQKYQANEGKLYQKACTPRAFEWNPQKRCQEYHKSRAAREGRYLKIRGNQLAQIKATGGRFNNLSAHYSAAIKRQVGEGAIDDDPFGIYNYRVESGEDFSDFSLAIPGAPGGDFSRGPASGGNQVPGYTLMGPMGGSNPYGGQNQFQTQQNQFAPQPNYFAHPYRPFGR